MISKEGINACVEKYLLERLQLFLMQGGDMFIGISAAEQMVFVLAELMEGKQLNACGPDLLEPTDEASCIGALVIVAGNHGNAR